MELLTTRGAMGFRDIGPGMREAAADAGVDAGDWNRLEAVAFEALRHRAVADAVREDAAPSGFRIIASPGLVMLEVPQALRLAPSVGLTPDAAASLGRALVRFATAAGSMGGGK